MAVLVEDHVADPVEAVLDAPVPADPDGDGLGPGVGHGQGADQVDHLHRPARGLAAFGGAGASDLEHLGGGGEVHPPGCLEGFDSAPHPPTVRGVDRGDGRDVLPGQGFERLAQGLLVVLDRQEVVATALGDPLGGVHLGAPWRRRSPRPRPDRGAQAARAGLGSRWSCRPPAPG